MNLKNFTLFLFLSLLVGSPAYATVQSAAASETQASYSTAETALSRKEMRDFSKAKKSEMLGQQKAEKKFRFFNWLGAKLADTNEQFLAILLCFFLGGLGLHRVYLQSQPIIILWYFLTIGGFFGLIPLIDFIRLIMGQVDHYKGNDSLFRAFQ